MKKYLLSVVVTLIVTMMLTSLTIYAAIADEAYDYSWGHTYSGKMDTGLGGVETKYYKLNVFQKSLVFIKFVFSDPGRFGNAYIKVYNSAGKIVINDDQDFTTSHNATKGLYTSTTSRVLEKGIYYADIEDHSGTFNYSFYATVEPAISLSRPTIKSLSNSASKKMTVKISSVKNCTGYKIQYAKKSNFSDAKTITSGRTKTIGGLKMGDTYYVRVQAYAIYGTGSRVYSAWSPIKTINIKK